MLKTGALVQNTWPGSGPHSEQKAGNKFPAWDTDSSYDRERK